MTKHVKIALSASRDIPFNQLVLSQANVRRVKAGVSIDALAADIARRGLLQSLTVRAQRDAEGQETGKFEVPAGGRRFRALQQLVKAKRMSRTEPVPCIVRDDDTISAEEDSLAENTHREALHPRRWWRPKILPYRATPKARVYPRTTCKLTTRRHQLPSHGSGRIYFSIPKFYVVSNLKSLQKHSFSLQLRLPSWSVSTAILRNCVLRLMATHPIRMHFAAGIAEGPLALTFKRRAM